MWRTQNPFNLTSLKIKTKYKSHVSQVSNVQNYKKWQVPKIGITNNYKFATLKKYTISKTSNVQKQFGNTKIRRHLQTIHIPASHKLQLSNLAEVVRNWLTSNKIKINVKSCQMSKSPCRDIRKFETSKLNIVLI